MHQSPAEVLAFSIEIAPVSMAASSTVVGAGVDMKGWQGVLFFLMLGVTDGTTDMNAQDSPDNSAWTDIDALAKITQLTATDDGKGAILDVYGATERYVRCSVDTGAGATADFECVVAVRYRATGRLPVEQHATMLELVKFVA